MEDTGIEIQFQLYHAARVQDDLQEAPPAGQSHGRLPRVTQVLALALSFQDMIRRGEAKDYADAARLRGVTRERLSQIMKLVWLAPDIQTEILYLPPTPMGRFPISESLLRQVANEQSWKVQRAEWNRLRTGPHCG